MTSYEGPRPIEPTDPAVLSISEVASRSGLTVAGLRNWEVRYGLLKPQRTQSGRRRYRESDCRLVADVLRRRDRGLSLGAAISQALDAAHQTRETSLFAGLRRRQPGLAVHTVDKRLLLALTLAIEDQCCAAAKRPLLLAAFQQHRHYRSAHRRWVNLAATAEQVVVFAEFGQARLRPGPLAEIPIPSGSPLCREWALICDAPHQPARVIGWEPPGQEQRADRDRTFETVWSVDPKVVRQASRLGLELAVQSLPALARETRDRLAEEVRPASPDLQRASGLLERTLDYVGRR